MSIRFKIVVAAALSWTLASHSLAGRGASPGGGSMRSTPAPAVKALPPPVSRSAPQAKPPITQPRSVLPPGGQWHKPVTAPPPRTVGIDPRRGEVTAKGRVWQIPTSKPGVATKGGVVIPRDPKKGVGQVHERVKQWRVGPSTHGTNKGSTVIRPERGPHQPVNPAMQPKEGSMAKSHPYRHLDPSTPAGRRDMDRVFGSSKKARPHQEFNGRAAKIGEGSQQ